MDRPRADLCCSAYNAQAEAHQRQWSRGCSYVIIHAIVHTYIHILLEARVLVDWVRSGLSSDTDSSSFWLFARSYWLSDRS